jgi:hypothetical protein
MVLHSSIESRPSRVPSYARRGAVATVELSWLLPHACVKYDASYGRNKDLLQAIVYIAALL